MIKTIQSFTIERIEILNEKGEAEKKLLPKISEKQILEMYRWMHITRTFDKKALALQRTGRLGTYASMLGQEAAIIGSAYALRKQDWLFPSFRYSGGMLLRGIPMDKLYSYWGGDERGAKPPEHVNVFPLCITVGEQPLHATGYAWGLKLKKQNAIVLTDFGDGATSTGDLNEALNFAGVFQAPVVFLCQNNQFAISISQEKQTAAKTLAQKAIAAGIKGVQVDGNDIFAVYKATQDAIADALKGKPTFIECYTYRISDHTTSDDATKYRSEKEVQEWKKKDPIQRLKFYMEKKKIWNEKKEQALQKEIELLVDKAGKSYEAIPRAPREDIFKYTIAGGVK
ncbi:MAG TPA: pyruvate dehydrogenase (acetyl-transferring) E1 component subunit alpha [Nanoarchaeota archaeon]|nr:pyruvate dehydrogenase (acetyl-transferring) E1 component subunit alpha [Candidatus Woesearchaeota archaeon]HIH14622.1 pyruvate dehydrogenase (acetyl-transferring) E1 component subunit alpha [Nanoarchaeota archaeon]HIH59190.1 pyruvate dehydrogenase (acetyl-transferring) E1 component subunit alpha [Nanoarchaeota archaeon]HII13495.1 pyruvate dehydrogenase (acetyl-transferring) E1 component subunit alpha [Nanoarchaeota archaeon]HIJ05584.1 pyruvate dehydrogenase (acetyl-transferring) E1 componen